MALPDYRGGSIVNLMSSVVSALGSETPAYPALRALPHARLAEARHVVLFVIDGLGYRHLVRDGSGGGLRSGLEASITSVFPPTTASAITTFLTGTAPQQHGITGWFTYFKEIGAVATVLPFTPRFARTPLTELGINPSDLFRERSIFERVERSACAVLPRRIVDSAYTRAHGGNAERRAYDTLSQCCDQIQAIARDSQRRFVYAYYPDLDTLGHLHGIGSAEVSACLAGLDRAFESLVAGLRRTGTLLIVTADHGAIDVAGPNFILVRDHPELAETLALPLCGEPRAAYCYVRADARARFEEYVRKQLGHCATCLPSESLVRRAYFGLGEAHPRLAQRIGDYTLLMKEGWAIADPVLGDSGFVPVGVHGGTSAEELEVPLILAGP